MGIQSSHSIYLDSIIVVIAYAIAQLEIKLVILYTIIVLSCVCGVHISIKNVFLKDLYYSDKWIMLKP